MSLMQGLGMPFKPWSDRFGKPGGLNKLQQRQKLGRVGIRARRQ